MPQLHEWLYIFLFINIWMLLNGQRNYLCEYNTIFTANTQSNWNYDSQTCELSVTACSNCGAVVWIGDKMAASLSWTDYTVKSELKMSGGLVAGIVFRAKSISNSWDGGEYYYVALKPGYNQIGFCELNGNLNCVTDENSFLSYNTYYELQIEIRQNQYDVYVDGSWEFAYTDSTFSSGSVGFRVYGATVTFKSLYVIGPTDPPTTATPTSIPTTAIPTTAIPTTAIPTAIPTTSMPTTAIPTAIPTTDIPTTAMPTTAIPTTDIPTTSMPTTSIPTTSIPTTISPTTAIPTTDIPTTSIPTTLSPTVIQNRSVPTIDSSTILTIPDNAGGVIETTRTKTITTVSIADELNSDNDNVDVTLILIITGCGILCIVGIVVIGLLIAIKKQKKMKESNNIRIKSVCEVQLGELQTNSDIGGDGPKIPLEKILSVSSEMEHDMNDYNMTAGRSIHHHIKDGAQGEGQVVDDKDNTNDIDDTDDMDDMIENGVTTDGNINNDYNNEVGDYDVDAIVVDNYNVDNVDYVQ